MHFSEAEHLLAHQKFAAARAMAFLALHATRLARLGAS